MLGTPAHAISAVEPFLAGIYSSIFQKCSLRGLHKGINIVDTVRRTGSKDVTGPGVYRSLEPKCKANVWGYAYLRWGNAPQDVRQPTFHLAKTLREVELGL